MTLGAVVIALGFLVAAAVSVALPEAVRVGTWLPIHLALAGAATTAIAGVMPFFAAAFAAAPPADGRLRGATVAAVTIGTVAISVGVPAGRGELAVLGGILFLLGIGLTGVATVRPLRQALGPSRGLIIQGYLVALGAVALGAIAATLYLAGWPPVVGAWASIKPAHAWLNLIGFVSLVIATTLLHFFPTVIGARIVAHPTARATVVGLGVGAPVVAVAFVVHADLLARLGAVLVLGGAVSLAAYAWRAWASRGRWTTDLGWHRFAMGGLISAMVWLEVGVGSAAARVLVHGADPLAWRADAILGPLVVGWVGLAIVASATHLLPAIGPGDQATHARQRRRLGRWATARLALIDAGVGALTVGIALGVDPLGWLGAGSLAIGLTVTVGLLLSAVTLARA